MKFFYVFTLLLAICGAALLGGCDEGVDMVKPILPGDETQEPEIPVTMGEMKMPEEPEYTPPAEITYYRDAGLTIPVTNSVELETTLYIQVVFSEEVPVVIADDRAARPSIFLTVRPDPENSYQTTWTAQYRMKPRGTELQSGDAMPYQDAFLCKYVVGTEDLGKNFLTHTKVSEGTELKVILLSYVPADAWKLQNDHSQAVQENPNDFVGVVRAAHEYPVPDATVTIMAGPRTGERVITDLIGQYTFRDVAEDELHLRVEKEYFEPKEVIVYRDRQTILTNGDKPNFRRRQKTPGRIQIGQRWPDEIRPILENTLVVYDLLYYTIPSSGNNIGGSYIPGSGRIEINPDAHQQNVDPANSLLFTLAHEIAHAHQHAVISIDGSMLSGNNWDNTPEGRAFAEARQKDWEEFGKVPGYDTEPYYLKLHENAAEVCAYYWIIYPQAHHNHLKLEDLAPHRFKWVEEWLGKK